MSIKRPGKRIGKAAGNELDLMIEGLNEIVAG
jgi:hypothetical protein